ncbi:MAG: peptidoglycan DD-metalloendopeptidase family protein [Anaerolineales bacterium]|nr:peptidoglycan DD-metalloendopeptidase family protein [Anaerolineales bacterium]
MKTAGQSELLLLEKAATQQPPAASLSFDPEAIAPPYDHYTLTQGPHGQSYGHLAIDISDGKGAVLKSPINGVVTALFTDDLGNTTLVIENEIYQVIMLHGLYTVSVGEQVALGQPIGKESNQGNTVDALGRSCRGRDCGYHTHLNIFDKRLGANVNPLELFQ